MRESLHAVFCQPFRQCFHLLIIKPRCNYPAILREHSRADFDKIVLLFSFGENNFRSIPPYLSTDVELRYVCNVFYRVHLQGLLGLVDGDPALSKFFENFTQEFRQLGNV